MQEIFYIKKQQEKPQGCEFPRKGRTGAPKNKKPRGAANAKAREKEEKRQSKLDKKNIQSNVDSEQTSE